MFKIILAYIQFAVFKVLHFIRAHDKYLIVKSSAFAHLPQPNMKLESPECGLPGGVLLDHHTYLDGAKGGRFPELHWNSPPAGDVHEFVLICEDPDVPIPFMVFVHGLFFGIPSTCFVAYHDDTERNTNVSGRVTFAGWKYVPNLLGSSYVGACPPYGHGYHRYVFTIVALSEPLGLAHPDKASVACVKWAMEGKVIGWGQWVGQFKRHLPQ
ncbi:YbhB/YbcL family Raf kinase inhibitor-like protein [Aspergillus ibericus CBS 121593]|uniref:PEBP-like protein n=1 Tax=Aspergillus ibericus CBS 121593 TaxID=1448316 RepID=A0A395HAH8_9EURO|nr:PEBP-like protein [Aspergillus ibericus CBS 121593]RAL04656.1 PEBP-like protein [Aspergillus ibericus CBS 121593]